MSLVERDVIETRTKAGEWAWFFAALEGTRENFDPQDPPSGFYRYRDRSLSVWRDAGRIMWLVSSGYQPKRFDEFLDMFASFCPSVITYDVWERHRDTGLWPESITAEVDAARVDPPGIGHNSRAANEEMADEIATLRRAFDAWFAEIGGIIHDQAADTKVKVFSDRMGALKKQAAELHRSEKEPFLVAGREIDTRWKPLGDRADREQREIAATSLLFRQERERQRAEAERKAREEAAEAKRQAAAEGKTIAVVAAPMRKQATNLRAVEEIKVDDLVALCAQLAGLNSPEVRTAAEKVGLRMLKAGAVVHGAHLETKQVAS